MKQKIIIRVDGSKSIGLGHLIRCIALAQMLKDKFEITFAYMDVPEEYITQFKELGFFFMNLDSEDRFFDQLNSEYIVVLDGYNFKIDYQKRIKNIGCKLVCIDDLHEDVFAADLIINHAPGVQPENYCILGNTDFALGLDYALLRPIFLMQATIPRKIKAVKTVLICFGGADYLDLTLKTVRIITKLPQFEKIIVITGASYAYGSSLNSYIENDNRIYRYHAATEIQMLESMLESDIAVVPTSGIFLEALTTGCRIVSGTYANNQKVFFERFKEKGLLFDANDFSEEQLLKAIQQAITVHGATLKLIDGRSGIRLLNKFTDLSFYIRKAQANDCELLFNWANDIDVRANAVSNKPIIWEDHVKWFNTKLSSDKTVIFLLMQNTIPVGQIRYDFDAQDKAYFIDYSIAKNFRGNGFGKKILKMTLALMKDIKVKAIVQITNTGSLRVFESLKFVEKESVEINHKTYRTLEYIVK